VAVEPLGVKTLVKSSLQNNKKAVLSHGEPCDAAANFDTYRILQ